MSLAVKQASVLRGGQAILDTVSLELRPGEVLAVLGPNGAGKSTLLKVLSGTLRPERGHATLDGKHLGRWPAEALARRRAVLSQQTDLNFGFRVFEVVLLGRSPHAGRASREADLAAATRALRRSDVLHLSERVYTTLSGGEQQRVQMARVLAQIDGGEADGERYLLLDEPTASLDLVHQHGLLRRAHELAGEGLGVLAILHDLNLAAMYADRLCLMSNGQVSAQGPPEEVLRPDGIEEAFGVSVAVTRHPTRDCLHVIPTC